MSNDPSQQISSSEDLLTEILSYLPIKPLFRFKSVSKHFQSLISTPSFSHLHTRRHIHHPTTALFFLHHHKNHHQTPSSSFDLIPLTHPSSSSFTPPSPFPFDILQSCNGLLLCSSSSRVHVFNPTTNQTVSIPLPPGSLPVSGFSLVFDLSTFEHFYIVCVSKDGDSFFIHVFSSGSGKWIQVVDLFVAPFDVEFERGVYHNGCVYWLSHTDVSVFFDLGNKCVVDLKMPGFVQGDYIERFRYFGESCGHLHLIEIPTNCVSDFDVLELGEGNEWSVIYRVNLDVVGCGFEAEMFQNHSDRFHRRFRLYAFSILAVVRGKRGGDGDDGDSELVVSVPGKVISYNFKTRVSKLISNVVDESDRWLPFKGYNAYQFIESLYRL